MELNKEPQWPLAAPSIHWMHLDFAELRSEQGRHRQELVETSANLKAAQDAVAEAEGLLAEVFRTRATQEAKCAVHCSPEWLLAR